MGNVETASPRRQKERGEPHQDLLDVLTAFRRGDFAARLKPTARVGAPVAEALNQVIELNQYLTRELERVSRKVGKEGDTSHRALPPELSQGGWGACIESVNSLITDLAQPSTEVARIIGAVARGDLSQTMAQEVRGRPLQGEFRRAAHVVNTMVAQLNSFAGEVTRVAREVGAEGKLGGQAQVKGVGGVWKDLTDNVNSMAGNLTAQVRNIAGVTTAVARGDLSTKITVDARGEILELKNTINTMVDQLNAFAGEVTRVAREVGTEGKLGGQAQVKGVGGVWKDLTDNVNSMAGNLTAQVRNIAGVTTAVAKGDLSTKITVDVRGEMLELKSTINTMVDQLNAFASEVTRVAREVGTEGKLGGQADVKGVGGVWKDLTDNVNFMAGNLTAQVRNIAGVTTAVAKGDLSTKITVDARGEILELKSTVNIMVDQLNAFASEVTRVAREVGTEGKLGGQADVKGVGGVWKDLTDNVNSMAGSLTNQVRNIAGVTTAVARGDLSTKITVDARGEILELKSTVNTMVDQLNAFASEVTRVAREVGTEGKLGGQADVKGVGGVWKDLTDNVNSMAGNLTDQVRNIAGVTTAVAKGDLSTKITVDVRGEMLELKSTINTMVDQLNAFASEVTRVAREVGTEGKLGGQAQVKGVGGVWKDLTDNVNSMAGNLTAQVRNIAGVTTAVARGDLSTKITVDVRGEILELKNTINTMVDQLNVFASEVTRVAREVGTEGKLGGQAQVKGVGGVWKDLTDNVNSMAANLTTQVRGIAKVVTAVANGDLKRTLALETKGEISELAETINGMIDTLALFADQVTSVAREVGIEGRLGGQARVPGAAGIWRDLTNNVNQLAANLTTQVRAIAEVATAVAKGDLTRSIAVEAQGEVAALKDNINEMIRNLKETTRENTEQDWLKTNLARFTGMLQGQRDLLAVARLVLSHLAPLVEARHGLFYASEAGAAEAGRGGANGDGHEVPQLRLKASYAQDERAPAPEAFRLGNGLIGQCALEGKPIVMNHAPADYLGIRSGLGGAAPAHVVVLPVLFEGQVQAVLELGSFQRFSEVHLAFLNQLMDSMGIVLNSIAASMRTEQLLKQSQALAHELQAQQEELTQTNKRLEQQAQTLQSSEELLKNQQEQLQLTNAELQEKALLLAEQKNEVERKNLEVEQARSALEEKARQLALTSKYKSEFLANMSHELRTPLNNLLLLAKALSENADGRLTARHVKFAETIHSSGTDLLALINDILDLSKIESGTMGVEVGEIALAELRDYAGQTFRHVAEGRGLSLSSELAEGLPAAIHTDPKRLQQILKNLLSNALKFTEQGGVAVRIEAAASGWSGAMGELNRADLVIAFVVTDTGIGIPESQHRVIFDAFRQADGTTSRKYGGTGLGLSISREIARLLGGEIALESQPGAGSRFTLYLPRDRRQAAGAGGELLAWPLAGELAGEADGGGAREWAAARAARLEEGEAGGAADDRDDLLAGEAPLLIASADRELARGLLAQARELGHRGLVAAQGLEALRLAAEHPPAGAVLDFGQPGGAEGPDGAGERAPMLADVSAWTVLERLEQLSRRSGFPIAVVAAGALHRRALRLGARHCHARPAAAGELEAYLDGLNWSGRAEPVRPPAGGPAGGESLRGRRVLIVDDDPRNIFALASVLEAHALTVEHAESGRAGIDCLRRSLGVPGGEAQAAQAGIDLVLMDIMMPEMDGFETTRAIRNLPEFAALPIIALTAKAMRGDREKCLEAGASDYIAKPVDVDTLLSLLRVWLPPRAAA